MVNTVPAHVCVRAWGRARSQHMRSRVKFEESYCLACGMGALDLRAPNSLLISLHGARQCNDNSLALVSVPTCFPASLRCRSVMQYIRWYSVLGPKTRS